MLSTTTSVFLHWFDCRHIQFPSTPTSGSIGFMSTALVALFEAPTPSTLHKFNDRFATYMKQRVLYGVAFSSFRVFSPRFRSLVAAGIYVKTAMLRECCMQMWFNAESCRCWWLIWQNPPSTIAVHRRPFISRQTQTSLAPTGHKTPAPTGIERHGPRREVRTAFPKRPSKPS